MTEFFITVRRRPPPGILYENRAAQFSYHLYTNPAAVDGRIPRCLATVIGDLILCEALVHDPKHKYKMFSLSCRVSAWCTRNSGFIIFFIFFYTIIFKLFGDWQTFWRLAKFLTLGHKLRYL